jgi:VanZ family protein
MRRIHHGRAWIFLVVWIAVTAAVLMLPFGRTPNLVERGYDKVIHTGLFTVMGIAAQAAAPWVSLFITVPVSIGLELVQKQIPGRIYSFIDLLANLTGIILGLFSFELSARLMK